MRYEYTLPSNLTDEEVYFWKLSEFSTCSTTCGGGIQLRHVVCYKRFDGVVEDKHCWANAQNKRPEKVTRVCNNDPCPAYWWVGPWQPCPVTCQKLGDTTPLKQRTILCVNQDEIALPKEECSDQTQPTEFEPCSSILPTCNAEEDNENQISWSTGPWQPCPVTCQQKGKK